MSLPMMDRRRDRRPLARRIPSAAAIVFAGVLVSCRTESVSTAGGRVDAATAAAAVTDDSARHDGTSGASPGSGREAYEQAYRRGVSLMETYLLVPRKDIGSDPRAQTDLRAAIASLDVAVRADPNSSSAWWARGKAQQLLGDHEEAYGSFHRSFKIDAGKNPDSGVQLVLECLETGRGGEAVEVAEGIVKTQPDNAGMLANLALAHLINGQIDDAVRVANAAAAIDPEDPATASAKHVIDDVRSGRRFKPQHISDLLLR
jgi:tetratricopeptide (TPR) repeat protein